METRLEHLLINSHKVEMIAYMQAHPGDFKEIIELAIADKHPYSWRASWVLWSFMNKNDSRVVKYIPKIIEVLPLRKDNQQRELMMVLQHMNLKETHSSKLFDICVSIWSRLEKQPSVRFNAFRLLMKIAEAYPELIQELKLLTEPHYIDSLSEGVKKSILKRLNSLDKTSNKK